MTEGSLKLKHVDAIEVDLLSSMRLGKLDLESFRQRFVVLPLCLYRGFSSSGDIELWGLTYYSEDAGG